jgi:hypothetical protein
MKNYLLRTACLFGIAILIILTSGCVPGFMLDSGIPDVVVVAQAPATSQVTSPAADAHFVVVNDYFIMEQPLVDQSYVYSAIARMEMAPSPATNDQGKFRRLLDDQAVWTKHYTKTRIARDTDFVEEVEIFFLNVVDDNGIYRAPQSSSECQTGWWYKARVTDISEKHRGFLTVSGGFRVHLNAIRVPIP